MEMLLKLLLIEFMFFTFIYAGLFFIELCYKFFSDLHKDVQAVSNTYATSEDEIYDTGFLKDMESFDTRVDDMRAQLENMPIHYAESPIEIMTDDYERSLEKM